MCCTFSYIGVGPGLTGPSPVQLVYQPPPWVQMTTPAPLNELEKGPVEWSLPQQVNLGNFCRDFYSIINTFPAAELFENDASCVTSSIFLMQWITTLISSSTCLEVTWTSASTSTPSQVTSLIWCQITEQVLHFLSVVGWMSMPRVWKLSCWVMERVTEAVLPHNGKHCDDVSVLFPRKAGTPCEIQPKWFVINLKPIFSWVKWYNVRCWNRDLCFMWLLFWILWWLICPESWEMVTFTTAKS